MATPLQNTLSRTLMNGNLTINGNISVNSTNIALGADLSGSLININSYVGTVATWNSSWSNATSGVLDNSWFGITYGLVTSTGVGRFVAVALDGTNNQRVMYSDNGITWSNATSGVLDNSWRSITYGLVGGVGRFVAVAQYGTNANGKVMYSDNGLTWSNATSGVFDNQWLGITYGVVGGVGRFVAVAQSGTTNGRVMYSDNGLTWSNATSGVLDNTWIGITYGLVGGVGRFVAVANSGTNNQRVMYSDNGLTWSNATSGVLDNQWHSITYGLVGGVGRFVAVAYSGSTNQRVMYSDNGLTWSNATSGVLDNNWLGITYGLVGGVGRFVAVAYSGTTNGRVMYSDNGLTWSIATSGVLSNDWRSITYGLVGGVGRFVAVAATGTNNQRVMYSSETVFSPGANSLSIGSDASFGLFYNSTAIGYRARCSASNQIVLGTSINTVSVPGALSKSSGTFDIIHPLDDSKRLLHSFVEGPRCDLIYRGSVTLVDGRASVNIDKECVDKPECQMSEGTFVALTANAECFLRNNQSFDRVKGTIENNILTIECNNTSSSDVINWLIIAERKDAFIKKWDKTNVDGFLITEHYIDDTRGPVHGEIPTPLLIDASGSSDTNFMPPHMMPGFSNDPTVIE